MAVSSKARSAAGDIIVLIASLVLFLGAVRVLSLWRGPYPFIWLGLVAIAVGLTNLLRTKSTAVRGSALVWISLSTALLLAEGAFIARSVLDKSERLERAGSYDPREYYVDDPELGYAVKPGITARARRFTANRPIYDATYTISSTGARFTRGNPAGETWLFMGCSRTFGEGVNDTETLPARFSAELGYAANVINLGFHGYGPHQMLRILETRDPVGAGRGADHVVYHAIHQHVGRAAGRAQWDLKGPRYELDGDSVVYAGPQYSRLQFSAFDFAQRSELARFFLDRLFFGAQPDDEEIELYSRIVERSARVARARFGADFTVLYWDENSETVRKVLERLGKGGITVVRASEFIPRNTWRNLVYPVDKHPTPEAYRLLARGLADYFGD